LKKKVLISVTSDLVTDQRVHKVSQTLYENGYDVLLIGRQLKNSLPLEKRDYETKRFRLWFTKTALFYINYNLRLFVFILFKKADIFLSNDLDTLLPNYLVSVIRNKPLVYDSHEYFTGVPELQHRPAVRKVWEAIERFIFPRLKFIYTVNRSIAKLYEEKYQRKVSVVRNVPVLVERPPANKKADGKKILIYQGSGININRGVEELVLCMKYLDPEQFELWVVGGGDVYEDLQKLAARNGLNDRIRFRGKVPFKELAAITREADLGLTIDKPSNINYLFSLPNKVFDYLHARLPVLASRLPEISAIIEQYQVGWFIDNHDPEHIASRISEIFGDTAAYRSMKENTSTASRELCWQQESKTILSIFESASQQQRKK
jgi:glycosyltransferase involved in cell wall biosynthesis